MAANRSGLVIDTTVARAAGETDHPTSSRCRKFLDTVLVICHCLVTSDQTQREWKRHASRYTRKWLVSMYARKKVFHLGTLPDHGLRTRLSKEAARESDLKAMLKDIHLIEAALHTDRRIISLDNEARSLFEEAARRVVELRSIVWVNPATDEEAALNWLEEGAKTEAERCLGYRARV